MSVKYSFTKRLLKLFVVSTVLVLMSGCGWNIRVRPDEKTHTKTKHIKEKKRPPGKVKADAWLFDLKIHRRGKPTTIRLEVFETETVLALGGRAYLGKGALKGLLTNDSLHLYFPTNNEHLVERLFDLSSGAGCPLPLTELNLLSLLNEPPGQQGRGTLKIKKHGSDKNNGKGKKKGNVNKPKYTITKKGCDWSLTLEYDRQNDRFMLKKLNFDDGHKFSLKANRREHKRGKKVPREKFIFEFPRDSRRIEAF